MEWAASGLTVMTWRPLAVAGDRAPKNLASFPGCTFVTLVSADVWRLNRSIEDDIRFGSGTPIMLVQSSGEPGTPVDTQLAEHIGQVHVDGAR